MDNKKYRDFALNNLAFLTEVMSENKQIKAPEYLNEFHKEYTEQAMQSVRKWKESPRTIEDVKRQQAMHDKLLEEKWASRNN